jgi:hypothetical protein
MAHRRRRINASYGRPVSQFIAAYDCSKLAQQKRLTSAESPPPQRHRSPLASIQPSATHSNKSNAFPHRRSTSVRPSVLFQGRPRAHSITQTETVFKAAVHSNPYLASRCRTLKSQTGHLKQKLEELTASIEELQPEHSAMDWAASAGTIIYVPVRVTKDNEAPRASPALPEVKGPEGSTFPDASQYLRKPENGLGLGRATVLSSDMDHEQTQAQPNVFQPACSGWNPAFGTRVVPQSGSTTELAGQNWTHPCASTYSLDHLGGRHMTATGMAISDARRPRNPETAPLPNQSGPPRHAYAEDERPEESGWGRQLNSIV